MRSPNLLELMSSDGAQLHAGSQRTVVLPRLLSGVHEFDHHPLAPVMGANCCDEPGETHHGRSFYARDETSCFQASACRRRSREDLGDNCAARKLVVLVAIPGCVPFDTQPRVARYCRRRVRALGRSRRCWTNMLYMDLMLAVAVCRCHLAQTKAHPNPCKATNCGEYCASLALGSNQHCLASKRFWLGD